MCSIMVILLYFGIKLCYKKFCWTNRHSDFLQLLRFEISVGFLRFLFVWLILWKRYRIEVSLLQWVRVKWCVFVMTIVLLFPSLFTPAVETVVFKIGERQEKLLVKLVPQLFGKGCWRRLFWFWGLKSFGLERLCLVFFDHYLFTDLGIFSRPAQTSLDVINIARKFVRPKDRALSFRIPRCTHHGIRNSLLVGFVKFWIGVDWSKS